MTPEEYQHVKKLFHELEGLPAAARQQRIAEESLTDEMRDALTDLLELDKTEMSWEDRLDQFGHDVVGGDSASFGKIHRIGSYSVLRSLGEGGMGAVYLARREDSSQLVAVKVVRSELAADSLVRRFLREAEVLRRLRHPGIAAFYDAGEAPLETSSGVTITLPYLAMEFIDGEPLSQYAQHHVLDDRQRLQLMAEVCDAVHHAHEQGIVHRDLKPENVLVMTTGTEARESQPKVLDFGLAQVSEADVQTMTQTQAGMIMGTVPYMSPEQVTGNLDALDRRSDVYSLGVMLFELLSGQMPYPVRGRPILEAAGIIQNEDPSRLGSLMPGLAGDIDHIVAQALEKEPARRYQSAKDLADDLRAAWQGRQEMGSFSLGGLNFQAFADARPGDRCIRMDVHIRWRLVAQREAFFERFLDAAVIEKAFELGDTAIVFPECEVRQRRFLQQFFEQAAETAFAAWRGALGRRGVGRGGRAGQSNEAADPGREQYDYEDEEDRHEPCRKIAGGVRRRYHRKEQDDDGNGGDRCQPFARARLPRRLARLCVRLVDRCRAPIENRSNERIADHCCQYAKEGKDDLRTGCG